MTDAVTTVYDAFEAVLGTATVRGENFFQLGGDSLAALEIATKVEDQLGIEFPIGELFASGDIDAIAQIVKTQLV